MYLTASKIAFNISNYLFGFKEIGIVNSLILFTSKHIFKNTPFSLNLNLNFNKNYKFYIRNNEDASVFIEHILTPYYSFKIKSNRKNFILIDCGGFNGIESLRLKQIFIEQDKKLKIFIIEANKINYDICVNHFSNDIDVKLYNKVLYHTSKETFFEKPGLLNQGFSYSKKKNKIKNETISINDIISKNKINKVDILKIDIEGLEKNIFEKNTEWINKIECIVIEYFHLNDIDEFNLLFSLLINKGFKFDIFKENFLIYKKNSVFDFTISRGFKNNF